MVRIRKAATADSPQVAWLLDELELWHRGVRNENFWVAEDGNRIVGIAHLQEAGKDLFVSSVGVHEEYRGLGVASELVSGMLAARGRDVYLYTVIPGFFKRLGFVPTVESPSIPSRDIYECSSCEPARCICMVRRADVA